MTRTYEDNEMDWGSFWRGALLVGVIAFIPLYALFVSWPDGMPDGCSNPTRLYEPDGSYVLTYECEAPK